jgi:RimJ/RimL family protein N-acetyltransferase
MFANLCLVWAGTGSTCYQLAAVLAHGRTTLGIERIVAITALDNEGSIAVLRKVGLTFERLIKLAEGGPDLRLFGPSPATASRD